MKKSDFTYDLPEELIAQTPLEQRDSSRLMVLDKNTGQVEHRHFYQIGEYLNSGDCLVINDTRVIPARLYGQKTGTGGAAEVLLLKDLGQGAWECIVYPGRRLKAGAQLTFGDGRLTATVRQVLESGNRIIDFSYQGIFLEILNQLGEMPLPHYIKEKLADPDRYQTVYCREPGSAAAPTAGLHFTPELMEQLKNQGILFAPVTLHVGLGTFRPVKEEEITDHVMHSEQYFVTPETAEIINRARRQGGRIIAVGTTSCRTLETVADENRVIHPGQGSTDIFIYPGYTFKGIDALITNFHLPESTLVMLVSALAGREQILNAYRIAVQEQYRFFSFGDAMLIR